MQNRIMFSNRWLSETPSDPSTINCYVYPSVSIDPLTASGLFYWSFIITFYDWVPGNRISFLTQDGELNTGFYLNTTGSFIYEDPNTAFTSTITHPELAIVKGRTISIDIIKDTQLGDWKVLVDDIYIGQFSNTGSRRVLPVRAIGGNVVETQSAVFTLHELKFWIPDRPTYFHWDGAAERMQWFVASNRAIARNGSQFIDATGNIAVGSGVPFVSAEIQPNVGTYMPSVVNSAACDVGVFVEEPVSINLATDPAVFIIRMRLRSLTTTQPCVLFHCWDGTTSGKKLLISLKNTGALEFRIDDTAGTQHVFTQSAFFAVSDRIVEYSFYWDNDTRTLACYNQSTNVNFTLNTTTKPTFNGAVPTLLFAAFGGTSLGGGALPNADIEYLHAGYENQVRIIDFTSVDPSFLKATALPKPDIMSSGSIIGYALSGVGGGFYLATRVINSSTSMDLSAPWIFSNEPNPVDIIATLSDITDIRLSSGKTAFLDFETLRSWFSTSVFTTAALEFELLTKAPFVKNTFNQRFEIQWPATGTSTPPTTCAVKAYISNNNTEYRVTPTFTIYYLEDSNPFEPTFFDSSAFETQAVTPTLIYYDSFESTAFQWTAFNMTYSEGQPEKLRKLKYYTGTEWRGVPLKMWNGAAWVEVALHAVASGNTFTKVSG